MAKARVESCWTLEGQGMSYGTQPHDWKLGELEYAGIPCLVFSATEHGILWKMGNRFDPEEHQKAEAVSEFEVN